MADLFEFTTWPLNHYAFYKVNGSGLCFDVKAMGYAVIGLSNVTDHCRYWIALSAEDNRSWIRKDHSSGHTVVITNLLSSIEYRSFWLSWHRGSISVGRLGERLAFLNHPCKEQFKYITFGVADNRNPVHWKIELPPIIEKPVLRNLSTGYPAWVPVEDQLPDGSMIGGYEKEILYIIRANHRGSLTPGKFVQSEGVGYISWGGDAYEKNELEVLCGYNCSWVLTQDDEIPVNAIVGGHSEDRQERLYIGRAYHNGHLVIGKVQPTHKTCYIAFNGREISKKSFEILVAVDEENRRVEKFLNTTLYSIVPRDNNRDDSDNDEQNEDHQYDYAF